MLKPLFTGPSLDSFKNFLGVGWFKDTIVFATIVTSGKVIDQFLDHMEFAIA